VEFVEEVTIAASVDTVWGVLMNLEAWPTWTRTMKSVTRRTSGELTVGSRVRVVQPFMTPHTWTVTELVRLTTFTWETRQLGVRLIARHDLSSTGSTTTARISARIDGPLGRVVARLAPARIRHFVRTEAAGLAAQSTLL
jgi:uncharacterized protein YndB with AHSA1/START domain